MGSAVWSTSISGGGERLPCGLTADPLPAAPSTHPSIPAPRGKAEVLAMKKDRGQVVAHVLGQVRTRVRARNLSPRTEKTYLGWIERYVGFHGLRDPAGMGRADIEAFLGHLGAERTAPATRSGRPGTSSFRSGSCVTASERLRDRGSA